LVIFLLFSFRKTIPSHSLLQTSQRSAICLNMSSSEGSLHIEFAGHELELLPERAICWPARQTLLIADAHFGKDAAFRAMGVPVPAGSTTKDLSRLGDLLHATRAKRLLILGDLLHARAGCQPEVFDAIHRWRREHGIIEMILIRGNHDRSSGDLPSNWNIRTVDELEEDAMLFRHQLPSDPALPTIAGHVHPVATLRDFDGSTISAPCFVFDPRCALLPSFGTFTGGHPMPPEPGRRLYLTAAGRVIAMTTAKRSTAKLERV
jgi:DNA ligase-associated metallophosphoesterase